MTRWGTKIVDGELVGNSPSGIILYRRCPRRWAFRYILGIKEPPGGNALKGQEGHDRLANYCSTGEDTLTDIERAGRRLIPAPRLLAHLYEDTPTPDEAIKIAGVPTNTKLDQFNWSGSYITPEGQRKSDPAPEVNDWKYSSDPRKWGKSAQALQTDVQMVCYGAYGLEQLNTRADAIRLSQTYFKLGQPYDSFKVTTKVSADHIGRELSKIEATVEEMKRDAKVLDPNDLPPVLTSCRLYPPNGCPYQGKCRRDETAAIAALRRPGTKPTEGNPMSILDRFKKATTPAPAETVDEAKARLEQQERVLKVQLLLSTVAAAGFGAPPYQGELAGYVAQAMGIAITNEGIPGTGDLASMEPLTELAQLEELAQLCKGKAEESLTPPESKQANPPAEPVPPEDLAAMPPKVAAAVEAKQGATAPATIEPAPAAPFATKYKPDLGELEKAKGAKKPTLKGQIAMLQDEINQLMRQIAAGGGAQAMPDDSSREVADLEKRLRDAIREIAIRDEKIAAFSQSTVAGPAPAAEIQLWINCIAPHPTSRLDSYVSEIVAKVTTACEVPHLLAIPDGHKFSFGKWKGLIHEVVAANPPAPGQYSALRLDDDVSRVVVEAVAGLAGCQVMGRGL